MNGQIKENEDLSNIQEGQKNLLNETIEQTKKLRENLENHVANGLCTPLYELVKITQEPPPDNTDTITRLEILAQGPKKEYRKNLIGVVYYPLDENGNEALIVLTDGTFIKISADNITNPDLRKNFTKQLNKEEIARENLFNAIKNDPAFELTFVGTRVVYQTNTYTTGQDQIDQLFDKDLKIVKNLIEKKLEITMKGRLKHMRRFNEMLSPGVTDQQTDINKGGSNQK